MAYIPVADTLDFYMNEDEIGWVALGPAVGITAIASVVVALRLFSRYISVRRGDNDGLLVTVLLVISLLLSRVFCITMDVALKQGFGVYTSRDVNLTALGDYSTASNILWAFLACLIKTSIILQYAKLHSSRAQSFFSWLIFIILFLFSNAAIVAGPFRCRPDTETAQTMFHGHCIDPEIYWELGAMIDLCTNWMIFAAAFCVAIKLQPSLRERRCLVLLFFLGFLACVISLSRLLAVHFETEVEDHIKASVSSVLWTAVEIDTGIILAALMGMRPLIMGAWRSSSPDFEPNEDSAVPMRSRILKMVRRQSQNPMDTAPDRTYGHC